MASWCKNELTITGPDNNVSDFFDYAHGKGENGEPLLLDFNRFVPQPESFTRDTIQNPPLNCPADIDASLRNGWRMRHWGTKWQPEKFQGDGVEVSCGRLGAVPTSNGVAAVRVIFHTAWSPPIPVLQIMSMKFPTLEFDLRYFEWDMGFKGLIVCSRGEIKAEETWRLVSRHGD